MFIDQLANPAVDAALTPPLQRALAYLRTTDVATVPPGRYELDGDRLVAMVQEYTTKPAADCKWEAHRKYIDVQYVVHGIERMGYVDIAATREIEKYDPERDVAFFEPGHNYVTVPAGTFTVFWPHDVHAPQCAVDALVSVRKVVVKVAVA
jgi:YhcH/YjgK/YiaL family protein